MSLGRVLRVLLAAALLSAQNAALAHGIWHFGDGKSQPAQKQLCGQHEALASVAGALDSPALPLAPASPERFSPGCTAIPEVARLGLAPSSRGPPALP